MDAKLRAYETFKEGGVRLQIEMGRPTTMAETALTVFVYGKDTERKQFYLNCAMTIEEIKKFVSEEFGLTEAHTFFKCDAFEMPT